MKPVERRHRRSERVGVALTYQLEHVTEVEKLWAFVLADRNGLALAAATPASSSVDVEELSALCPLLGSGQIRPEVVDSTLGGSGGAVELLPVDVDGEPLYLLSVASGPASAHRAVERAAAGVRRILGSFEP
jgi:hypothetical protein